MLHTTQLRHSAQSRWAQTLYSLHRFKRYNTNSQWPPLLAKAYAASGNFANSASLTVTVKNSTGNTWAKAFDWIYTDSGNAVAMVGCGNIVVVRTFQGSVIFEGSVLGSPGGYSTMFVAKFVPS